MKKLVFISFLLTVVGVEVNAGDFVIESGYGSALTLKEANKQAFDRAKIKVVLGQPKLVYSDTTITNDKSKYRVITIPAHVEKAKTLEASVEVVVPTYLVEKDIVLNSNLEAERLDVNELGHPVGTIYNVTAKFEFYITPAKDIDRAKFLQEYMALKEASKNGMYATHAVMDEIGLNANVFNEMLVKQGEIGDKNTIGSIVEAKESVDAAVEFYQKHYLDALVNTYQDFEIYIDSQYTTKTKGGRKGSSAREIEYQIINIEIKGGCEPDAIKVSENDQVGNLCDLYKTLPKSVRNTISELGLSNSRNSQSSDDEFLFDPLKRLRVVPTTDEKSDIPLTYAGIVSRNIENSIYHKQLAIDVYSAKYFSVLPHFITRAVVGEASVVLTLFFSSEDRYVDIPITSDRYILGNQIYLAVPIERLNGKLRTEDVVPVLWNSKNTHPAQEGWKEMGLEVNSLSLPELVTLKTQGDFLSRVREYINQETGLELSYKQKLTLSSPIKYLSCKAYTSFYRSSFRPNCMGLSDRAYFVAGGLPSEDTFKNYHPVIKTPYKMLNLSGMKGKQNCLMFSYELGRISDCNRVKGEEWLMSLGRANRLTATNTPAYDIISTIGKNNKPTEHTKTSTNPSLFW